MKGEKVVFSLRLDLNHRETSILKEALYHYKNMHKELDDDGCTSMKFDEIEELYIDIIGLMGDDD